ncbi:MAG TPA: hypothetical protein VMB76_11720 [Casimicrobiaceae bacterium]|nr:hypothetical protein [Casimicrobiaceae bacterium]
MTPQSTFMVLAPIDRQRERELRDLLQSMNGAPGQANPVNELLPFEVFDTLHFARLLIVDDQTLLDARAFGLPRPSYPLYLAFLGDVDGDAEDFLKALAARTDGGLRRIFGCCEGFTADTDLLRWMREHSRSASAQYVNWRGRTVRRVREEAALREALERYLDSEGSNLATLSPQQVHAQLRRYVAEQGPRLTPEAPTPFRWWLANLAHLVGMGLVILVFGLALLVVSPVAVWLLRRREKLDPEMCFRVEQSHSDALALIEDHAVMNQFSALGAAKPGWFRATILGFVLIIIDYVARHWYTRGRLARVRSIHFARWVWIDPGRRMAFMSNYDGSLESYMDDFINKVGFGLNVVFSNAIGYPTTNWLIADGCKDERKFKEYLRRHQLPTQVWFSAYPKLSAVDLERNGRIREGFERAMLSEARAREWVGLL